MNEALLKSKWRTMNKICKIYPESIAEEVSIAVGDEVIKINGYPVEDILDFIFLLNDEYVEIELKKSNGEIWDLEIEKDYDEPLGVEFENPIMDDAKRCHNQCVFCFIDQLPCGMRDSLYFKDDDSRLSFLQGNFITLTNLKKRQFERIIKYRMSPINVSVHTTNPDLRIKMLGNRFAGEILNRVKTLTDNGIVVNAQIVLCPGYNDGLELEKTLNDLSGLNENLNSVAVVPIGLTDHRQNLIEMDGFNCDSAKDVIDFVEEFQRRMLVKRGSRFVFLADEFYIMANTPFPNPDAYEGFLQFEDGIGMIQKLYYEVDRQLTKVRKIPSENRFVKIITGFAAAPYLEKLAHYVISKYPMVHVEVQAIQNNYFGNKITVAGLLTGKDIISQTIINKKYDVILTSIFMYKSGEEVLLDDMTRTELEQYFGYPVEIIDGSGAGFIDAILYGGTHE